MIALVGLACGSSSPTEAPPEPIFQEPTEEPQQDEPTPEPQQPEAEDFFTEEFDNGNDNWSYFVVDGKPDVPLLIGDDLDTSELYTEDGRMIFDLVNEGQWVYAFYDPYVYTDVRLDVIAENRGTNNNNVSLICRYSEDEGWYEYNVANNGLWWLYHGIINSDGEVIYRQLADGGSNEIKQGKETNQYTITCQERTLTLYINGKGTRPFEDNQLVLREGQIGVSVSSFRDLPVTVEIESVQISQP
jgi:hypothetical protein